MSEGKCGHGFGVLLGGWCFYSSSFRRWSVSAFFSFLLFILDGLSDWWWSDFMAFFFLPKKLLLPLFLYTCTCTCSLCPVTPPPSPSPSLGFSLASGFVFYV